MPSMPPGWYDDGRGALRWWDGTQWTEHVATPDPEPSPGAAPVELQAEEPLPPELAEAETPAVPPYAAAGGYPGADPSGYPGGFPGGVAPAGAFVSATEPAKSKTWIVWVVIGVVLLGIVIAAAVILPLLFLSFAAGGGSTAPDGADETEAVSAVMLYDDAWQEADCDKLAASTTEEFRVSLGIDDCVDFEEASASFTDSVDNYEVVVTSIDKAGDTITVSTTESYDALYDEDDQPLDQPVPASDQYRYVLVSTDDGWVIDDLPE